MFILRNGRSCAADVRGGAERARMGMSTIALSVILALVTGGLGMGAISLISKKTTVPVLPRILALSMPDPILEVKTGLNLFNFFNTEIPEDAPHVLLVENKPQFDNKIDVKNTDYTFVVEIVSTNGVYVLNMWTENGVWKHSVQPGMNVYVMNGEPEQQPAQTKIPEEKDPKVKAPETKDAKPTPTPKPAGK